MKRDSFQKRDFIFIFLILFIALLFRLYKIDIPLADFHSWRQADTAAVAHNFVKYGFDLLHPRYDDFSTIQSGFENPQGYRMVEFPIYNAIFAYLYKIFPVLPLEIFGRLTTIFFSLITISIIYYFGLRESGRLTAVVAGIIYATMPFYVFFSRTVLPETTAIAFVFLAILFLYFFIIKRSTVLTTISYILSVVFFAISLLIKPVTVFYGLVFIYLFFRKYSYRALTKVYFYLFFILAIIPYLLWQYFIRRFPEGIPNNYWLITQVNTAQGRQDIFFKPAFFRWIFFERLNNLILGGYLSVFLILGVIAKTRRFLLHFILLSGLIFLFSVQGGNIQHEYYQIIVLPPLALFVGLGINYIINNSKTFLPLLFIIPSIIVIFTISFFFSYYKVKDYYQYPSDLVQIAKIVNTLTKEDDRIVTDRMGDTTLLYLMNRRGSPVIYKEILDLQKLNYQYLVTQNQDLIKQLKSNRYTIVFENNNFALIKL